MDDYPKQAPPPAEKSSAAKSQPKSGGGGGGEVKSTDWREQSEPHPQPPGTGPAPTKAVPKAAPMPPASRAFTPPTGYTAGTPIEITPYEKAGSPSIFMVGDSTVVGSEEDAAQTLRNMLHLPPIPVS